MSEQEPCCKAANRAIDDDRPNALIANHAGRNHHFIHADPYETPNSPSC